MENIDSNILQNFLNENTDGSVVPSINIFPDELVTAFTIGLYAISIVAILFVVAYIAGLIRKWKVDSAILEMQKDLKEIRESLSHDIPARHHSPADTDTSKIA